MYYELLVICDKGIILLAIAEHPQFLYIGKLPAIRGVWVIIGYANDERGVMGQQTIASTISFPL